MSLSEISRKLTSICQWSSVNFCSAETLSTREGAQHYCANLYGPLIQGGGVDLCNGRPSNALQCMEPRWGRDCGMCPELYYALLCPIILCHNQTARYSSCRLNICCQTNQKQTHIIPTDGETRWLV